MEEKQPKIRRVLILLIAAPIILAAIVMIVAFFIALGTNADAIGAGIVRLLPYILLINHAILFILLLLFLRADGITLSSIGWRFGAKVLVLEPLIGIVCGAILFAIYGMAVTPAYTYQARAFACSGINLIVWLVVVTIFAGIVEESVYRGYAIRRLGLRIGTCGALAVSSVMFGILHWGEGLWAMAGAVVFGLLLGLIFIWRKNLLAPAVAHAVLNLLIVI